MQTLAQSWLVYQLTGSAFLLGTVSFLQGLPSLFLALVGGVLADRVERRRLMLVTQVAQMLLALLLAGLTLTGVVRVEQIMVIAFLSGLVNAINTPVRAGHHLRPRPPAATCRTPSPSAAPSSRPASSSGRPSRGWWWPRSGPAGPSCSTA